MRAQEAIGSVTGSEAWTQSGEQQKAEAVDAMKAASNNRNPEQSGFGSIEEKAGKWIGSGEHLCESDMYESLYEFRLSRVAEEGTEMTVFGVRYKFKGPQKDYISDTAYEKTFSANTTVRWFNPT